MSIDDTLQERHKTHGSFHDNAKFAQNIKLLFRDAAGWYELQLIQQEALDLIATKISRILSTDGRHADGWHDIAGYATLVEKWLKGEVL